MIAAVSFAYQLKNKVEPQINPKARKRVAILPTHPHFELGAVYLDE